MIELELGDVDFHLARYVELGKRATDGVASVVADLVGLGAVAGV
jgi:hypothetical protein